MGIFDSPRARPALSVMTGVAVRIFAIVAVLAAGSSAWADEVILRNGAVFSGSVREEGDRVVVQMDIGTMSFKKVDVRSIVRSEDPVKELERKLKTTEGAQGHYDVAMWARERGLSAKSNEVLKKVIELDPDHADARKALGFEKVNGSWLEGDELKLAKGLIKYNGRWLPRETVERMIEGEKVERMEIDRRQIEQRAIDAQREVELAKVALERQRLEYEYERCGWGWSGGYLWGYWAPTGCRCGNHWGGGYSSVPNSFKMKTNGFPARGEPLPPVKQTVVPIPAPASIPHPKPR